MRAFGTGSGRLDEPVQIVGGARTRASIQRADLKDNPQVEFSFPKIACRVANNSLVRAGQVLKLQGDENYYLATDHSGTADYRVLHLFRCDRQVVWSRAAVTTDTLTGLAKAADTPTEIGSIYVMWERARRQFADTATHLNLEETLIATGADVQLNDFIAGHVVKRTTRALGVNILVLRE